MMLIAKIALCSALWMTSLHAHVTATATSCSGVIAVPLDELYLRALDNLTKSSPYCMQRGLLTRKKDNTALILLSGLAQACTAAGQAAGGQTQGEKQQGVLNIASTIFATSAALVADKQNKRSPATTRLVTTLAQQLEQPPALDGIVLRMPISPTMTLFKALPDTENQELFVELMLNNPELAEAFLNDLFSTAWSFISLHSNVITNVIDANVRMVVNEWQSEIFSTDNLPLASSGCMQSAMIIAAPQPGKPLNATIVEKIVTLVSGRLKKVFNDVFEGMD